MATIFVIDDDAAANLMVTNLLNRGHTAKRLRSVNEAIEHIEAVSGSDLVILDLIMPHGSSKTDSVDRYETSGMEIYRRLRQVSRTLPIIIYTANQDGSIVDVIASDPHGEYVPKWSSPSLAEFMSLVNRRLRIDGDKVPPKSFIVHGHDEAAKFALKNYLQNTLRLPEPIILHEQPNQGRTLLEKFEDLSEIADVVFVLLTPDDPIATASESAAGKRRARQNVIFELGYFLGAFGRHSGRVILLHKGALELPTDISGLVYVSIDDGVEAAGEQIRRELSAL